MTQMTITLDTTDFIVAGVYRDFRTVIANAPALQGSPKQVAWAESIRAESIRAWMRDVAIRGGLIQDPRKVDDSCRSVEERKRGLPMLQAQADKVAAKLGQVVSAKAWIEAAGGAKDGSSAQALFRA